MIKELAWNQYYRNEHLPYRNTVINSHITPNGYRTPHNQIWPTVPPINYRNQLTIMAPVSDVGMSALRLVEPHHAEEGRVRVTRAQAEVVLRPQRAPRQLKIAISIFFANFRTPKDSRRVRVSQVYHPQWMRYATVLIDNRFKEVNHSSYAFHKCLNARKTLSIAA